MMQDCVLSFLAKVEEDVAALEKNIREHGLPRTHATVIAYPETEIVSCFWRRVTHGVEAKDYGILRESQLGEELNQVEHAAKRASLLTGWQHSSQSDHIEDIEVNSGCGNHRLENIFFVKGTGLLFWLLPRRTCIMPYESRKIVGGRRT